MASPQQQQLAMPFVLLLTFIALPTNLTQPSAGNRGAGLVKSGFSQIREAYRQWDAEVGCDEFRGAVSLNLSANPSLQDPAAISCNDLELRHVSILVKKWTWIPDNMDNLYSCRCGMTCLWTKSEVLADKPDAELYESMTPPSERRRGGPLRVYMDLEAGRRSVLSQDIFVSYHADDTVQATYAGAVFHNHRSYFVSSIKNNDILVYWSSSRCLTERMSIANKLLSLLPHHSFGKCLNNVGGQDAILRMHPECKDGYGRISYWANHLHCAMSHYKFVLAIENSMTESYITEKLFYALDSGAVPIYFGPSNVWDFVPPNSIIDASKFPSIDNLASYVKRVAADPVLYAGYHAWRRCGVIGNYYQARAVSLDSLPCRLCATVSKLGGKGANAL
eukprot:c25160_g2_i1 orf=188-1360(+)